MGMVGVAGMTSFAARRLLAVPVTILVLFAASACTGGNGGGASADSTGSAGSAGGGAEGGVSDATGGAGGGGGGGGGDAESDADGAAREIPDLPPARAVMPSREDSAAADALAAMPGLYGLALLQTDVLDDRIEISASEDCAAVADILQAGQWALEFDGEPGNLGDVGDSGDSGDGEWQATLRLDDMVAEVRLAGVDGSCSGSIVRPVAR